MSLPFLLFCLMSTTFGFKRRRTARSPGHSSTTKVKIGSQKIIMDLEEAGARPSPTVKGSGHLRDKKAPPAAGGQNTRSQCESKPELLDSKIKVKQMVSKIVEMKLKPEQKWSRVPIGPRIASERTQNFRHSFVRLILRRMSCQPHFFLLQ